MGPSSLLRIRINSYTFGTPDASGTKDVFFLPELLRWWSPDGSPSSSWDESPDLSLIHPWNGYLKYPDSTHVYFASNTQMPRTKQWYPGTTRRPLLLGLPLQAWSCGWPPQVLSCTLGSCCPILFLPWPNRRLVGQIEGTIVCKTFPNGFLGSTEWTESGRLNVAWRSKSNFAKLESLLKAAVLRVCGGQSWTYLQLFLLSQESFSRGCASNGSTGDTSRASELSGLQRTSRACAFLCAAACISHGRHGSKLAAKSGGLMAPRKPGQSRGVWADT